MTSIDGYKMIFFLENLLREYSLNNIKKEIIPANILEEVKEIAKSNLETDTDDFNILILYFHLGTLIDLIKKNKQFIHNDLSKVDIRELIKHRNNVMHSRLINFNELSTIQSKCEEVIQSLNSNDLITKWHKFLVEDISEYEIPEFYSIYPVGKNFDSLIGRENELRKLRMELQYSTPVSVIGVGGLGKTALVLQLVEDYIYSPKMPFEIILFMSFKDSIFEKGEIQKVDKSITNHSDLILKMASYLDVEFELKPFEEVEEQVWDKIFERKTLLIIDNLETETVNSNLAEFSEIAHKFIRNGHLGSRLLMTSRFGLGERENPIPLTQFRLEETKQLMTYFMKESSYKLKKINDEHWKWIQKFSQGNPGFIIALCYLFKSSIKDIKDIIIEYEMENTYSLENTELAQLHSEFLSFCFENTIENLNTQAQYYLVIMSYICDSLNLYQINEELIFYIKDSLKSINKFEQSNLKNSNLVNVGFLQKHSNSTFYSVNELIVDYLDGNYSKKDILNVFKLKKSEYFQDVQKLIDFIEKVRFDKEYSIEQLLAELHLSNYRKTKDTKYMVRAFQCNPKIDTLLSLFRVLNDEEIFKHHILFDKLAKSELRKPNLSNIQDQVLNKVVTALINLRRRITNEKYNGIKTSELIALYDKLKSYFLILENKSITPANRIKLCKFLIVVKRLDEAESYFVPDKYLDEIKKEVFINQIGELAGSHLDRTKNYIDLLESMNLKTLNEHLFNKYLIYTARYYKITKDYKECVKRLDLFLYKYRGRLDHVNVTTFNFILESLLTKADCMLKLRKPLEEVNQILRDIVKHKENKLYGKLFHENKKKFDEKTKRVLRDVKFYRT